MWHAWERIVYRVLMVNPEGKRPLERPRRRWEDKIRMDLREIGWDIWNKEELPHQWKEAGHVARMGEECVHGFDGKARRKEATWKTKA
jgi:hypothetical protein